ncbi:Aste57867_24249 [Aphanomyces stellatus]|uniref:Aste57867_24249 protein n=1 Tax=Aphanomyces stellatus TaxID=120398 RepID=A0A485LPV0_9STRA|nr:hypothetical protein As57867_024174 [Aphanomyces stellatus]VFU00889.1 Aste57867_24249 [Aphanomyces stellatus]
MAESKESTSTATPRMPSVIYERGDNKHREITHATLGRLVAKLTDAHHYDTEFRDCFLLTYRGHSTVNDFVMKLIKRYTAASEMANPSLIDCDPTNAEEERFSVTADVHAQSEANISMMRAISVLKFWIRESGYIESDLKDDRRTQKKLMLFLAKVRDESPIASIAKHADTMLHVVGKIMMRHTPRAPASITMPSPLDLGSESNDESQSPKTRRRIPATIREDSTLPPPSSATSTTQPLTIIRSTSVDAKDSLGKPQVTIRAHPLSLERPRETATRPAFSAPPPSISRGKTMPPVASSRPIPAAGLGHTPLTRSTSDNTRERGKAATVASRSEPFSGMSAQDAAEQLTLLEEYKFQKIQPRELTNKNWTSDQKHDVAPNVMAFIEMFGARSDWVSSEVLHPKLQAVQRAKMIAYFIDVGEACCHLNNFNTLFEIVYGLNAPYIKQLETTWSLVPSGHLEKFEYLKHVCSTDDNYRVYRQAYAAAEGHPRLPPLFIVVKDIFGFEESMRTKEHNLIHFKKFRKIYKAITDALSCQSIKYTSTNAASRRRRVLQPDSAQQMILRYRLETIRKTSTELFWQAKNANKQESDQFVNSLADAGFM